MRNSSAPLLLLIPAVLGACEKGDTGDSGVNAWDLQPVYGVPNLDDDDQDGTADWDQAGVGADNDLAPLLIPAALRAGVAAGESLELTLAGETDGIRIWLDGEILLGTDARSAELPSGSDDLLLEVEFDSFLRQGSLTLAQLAGGGELRSAELTLLAAPMTMNHHLQAGNHLYVIDVSYGGGYDNQDMIDDLLEILGEDRVTASPGGMYGYDVWIQDELEFSWLRGEEVQAELIIDSIRGTNGQYLDAYPENVLLEPDVIVGTWGSGYANSLDSFGNLESSPPVTVDGIDYPLGRIYYGGSDILHPAEGLTSFLDFQQVQAPVRPDSTWLCVGHVDEYFTFVPDTSSEKGFKLLFTDVDVAYELLDSIDQDQALTKYATTYGYATVGELAGDTALRALNEDIQRDAAEPALETIKAAFGLDDSDIVRVPGIWEENQWCGSTVLALIPGLVNLAVFTEEEGDHKLLIADPFLRGMAQGQDEDLFIALWDSLMPPGNETFYLDNWEVYHEGWGEVHCGTNIRRDQGAAWWTAAQHLLGGE